jgi:hypothetical protein
MVVVVQSVLLYDGGIGVQVPVESRMFISPFIQPRQSPVQWALGLLLRVQSGKGVMLTTHIQLVPRPRKRGSIISTHIRHCA